jgi:hypothetical protein
MASLKDVDPESGLQLIFARWEMQDLNVLSDLLELGCERRITS